MTKSLLDSNCLLLGVQIEEWRDELIWVVSLEDALGNDSVGQQG